MSDIALWFSTMMKPSVRIFILIVFTVFACLLMFSRPVMQQNENYHAFVDQRTLLGIPHAVNVISNGGFLLAGVYGFCVVIRSRTEKRTFQDAKEIYAYLIFFASSVLISIGSSFYHLMPNNQHLLWDRLPMSLAFMALFAASISERIQVQLGVRLLPILLVAGVGSVLYWHLGQLAGVGDLRPYFLVQFYPMFAIPLLVLLGPARYTRTADLNVMVGIYALAKVAESLDSRIYLLSGFISGHATKHLLAGAAIFWIARMLDQRQPSPQSQAEDFWRNKSGGLSQVTTLEGEQDFTLRNGLMNCGQALKSLTSASGGCL